MLEYKKRLDSILLQWKLSSVSHMYGFILQDLLASSLSVMHVQVSDIFSSPLLKRTMLPLIRSSSVMAKNLPQLAVCNSKKQPLRQSIHAEVNEEKRISPTN
jgi:hypothetical protein